MEPAQLSLQHQEPKPLAEYVVIDMSALEEDEALDSQSPTEGLPKTTRQESAQNEPEDSFPSKLFDRLLLAIVNIRKLEKGEALHTA